MRSMKYIPLAKSMGFSLTEKKDKNLTFQAAVDDEDFAFLNQWQWQACKTVDGNIYARRFDHKKWFTMHRVLLLLPERVHQVDHRDGDGLNNQKSNLRLANDHQNQANRGKNKNNKSGYKGVTWCKAARKWQSQIMVHRHHHYLGLFEDAKEAAKTYDAAALRFFGEFARTNHHLGLIT